MQKKKTKTDLHLLLPKVGPSSLFFTSQENKMTRVEKMAIVAGFSFIPVSLCLWLHKHSNKQPACAFVVSLAASLLEPRASSICFPLSEVKSSKGAREPRRHPSKVPWRPTATAAWRTAPPPGESPSNAKVALPAASRPILIYLVPTLLLLSSPCAKFRTGSIIGHERTSC